MAVEKLDADLKETIHKEPENGTPTPNISNNIKTQVGECQSYEEMDDEM